MKHYVAPPFDPTSDSALVINAPLVESLLVRFLVEECVKKRRVTKAVVGLSGGVDSAVTTYLCAQAFGAENVIAIRMPYELSSAESLSHARLVVDALGIQERTIEITDMVNGYRQQVGEMNPTRVGNVCARCRMTALFDVSAEVSGLPIGTGNKTERLFGYFTWHADDAPPINPLGDLFKTQVWQLARHLGIDDRIVNKPPSADLVKGQTDEGDFGISYPRADRILVHLVKGVKPETLVKWGFDPRDVELVTKKVGGTHWKRKLPTVAMLTDTSINDYYLRPVDY